MTDHLTTPLSSRDVTARPQPPSSTKNDNNNHGPLSSPAPTQRRARTSSFDSHLSKFSKSSTASTTASRSSVGLYISHASAQVGVGEFSKPRVNKRSRRDTGPSSRSEGAARDMEFKYYGRHSNQWLFNDFSVTDAVARGFKRVFGRERGGGDWLEKREM